MIFWNDDKKRSEFDLGSAFFGISEVGFLPYGVQMKGVIEKGWNFDKKCSWGVPGWTHYILLFGIIFSFPFFMAFWNDDKKGRNLTSGVHFSESARSIFSLRVQNKRVIEKGWNFDKNVFDGENSIFDAQDSIWGV